MTSIDHLRSTLDRHADALADQQVTVRIVAVRARVGAVRRRRRAVAAGGLAAVVAVTCGVVLSHRDASDRTAPTTTVVGVPAPPELRSLGFTYALDQTADGSAGTVAIRLPASDEPRLVSWATSGDDPSVRVSGPMLAVPTAYDAPDFGDFTYVPAGSPARVRVTADQGEPGLAVYTLTEARPDGVTKDGVTFRRSLAGGTLLGAVVGDAGQREISVPATATGPGVAYKYYCAGGPAKAYLHVVYLRDDQQELVDGAGCRDGVPVDPAALGGSGQATRPGEDVGVSFYVTDGEDGPPVSSPDLRLGLGIYALDQSPTTVDGYVPATLESAGHVWQRVDVLRSTDGSRHVAGTAPAGQGVVLAVLYGDAGRDVLLRATLDGSPGVGIGGAGATQQVMAAGGTVRVSATGELKAEAEFGLALYVESD